MSKIIPVTGPSGREGEKDRVIVVDCEKGQSRVTLHRISQNN